MPTVPDRVSSLSRTGSGRLLVLLGACTVSLLGWSGVAAADTPIRPTIPSGGSSIPTTTVPTIPPSTVPGGGSATSTTRASTVTTGGGATTVTGPTTTATSGGGSQTSSGGTPWAVVGGGVLVALGAGVLAALVSRRRRTEVASLDLGVGGDPGLGGPTVAPSIGPSAAGAAAAAAAAGTVAGAAATVTGAGPTAAAGATSTAPSPAMATPTADTIGTLETIGSVGTIGAPDAAAPDPGPVTVVRSNPMYDVSGQLAGDWAVLDVAAAEAAALAGLVHRAGQDTIAGQAAENWAAADRRASIQRIKALEDRIHTLEGVEGADVARWREHLVGQLEQLRRN